MLNTPTAALSILIRGVLLAGLLAGLFAGPVAGCARGSSGDPEPGRLELGALAGEWRLESLDGYDALPDGVRAPTLRFEADGSVSGFSGVNRLAATLDVGALEDGVFIIGPAASTRMAGPRPAMELEQDFLTLLQESTGGRIDGDELILGDAEADLLVFRRVSR